MSKLEERRDVCRSGATSISPAGRTCYIYFDLGFVAPGDRLPVIRKGAKLFDWETIEEDRIDQMVKEAINASLPN